MTQKQHKKTTSKAKLAKKKQNNTETEKRPKDDPKNLDKLDYSFCRRASDFFWVEYAKRHASIKHSESYFFLKNLYETTSTEITMSIKHCKNFKPSCIQYVLDSFVDYKNEPINNNVTLNCRHESSKNVKCFECTPTLINPILQLTNHFYSDFGHYFVSIIDFFNYSESERTLEAFVCFSVDKAKNQEKYNYKYNAVKREGNVTNFLIVFPDFAPIRPPKPQLVTQLTSEHINDCADLIFKVHIDTPDFSVEDTVKQFVSYIWDHLKLYEDEDGMMHIKTIDNKTKQDIKNDLFFEEFYKLKRVHPIDGFLCTSIFQRLAGLLIWDMVNFRDKTMDEGIEFVKKKIEKQAMNTNFKTFKYSGYKDAYLKAKKYIQNFDPESLLEL